MTWEYPLNRPCPECGCKKFKVSFINNVDGEGVYLIACSCSDDCNYYAKVPAVGPDVAARKWEISQYEPEENDYDE